MKSKMDSEEREGDGHLDIDGPSTTRPWVPNQYNDRKSRSRKKPGIGLRLATEPGKVSTYSSSSRLTSLLRAGSVAQADSFKVSQSVFFNQLAQKYVPRGAPAEKVREQMQLALQRKRSEIEALRVHRDELKFISYNNPYDMPIKISLAVLKEKARAEQRVRDMVLALQKDIREIQFEFNTMTDYYNFVSNAVKSNGEDDLIIDTQEEERLMVDNLEKETNHLFRELKEEDKKNAKEIKSMQEEIALLRVYIKQKEDTIRDLKSKICTLHIKLHSRAGSSSKDKTLSLSIRKFITEKNTAIQQAFIGNNSFKHYSKEVLEKVQEDELSKLVLLFEPRRELIIFRCIYKLSEGQLHANNHDEAMDLLARSTKNKEKEREKGNDRDRESERDKQKQKEPTTITLNAKYLLSIKFYFKSKIVGVECRIKSEKGTELKRIGNCDATLEHQLLTLINKRVVTLSSYWHQKDIIGVGVWYCSRFSPNVPSRPSSKSSKDPSSREHSNKVSFRGTPRSPPAPRRREEENNQYYQT